MRPERDSPAAAVFCVKSGGFRAVDGDVDFNFARAPCMAAFERRPLSGSAFLFPAEFATAFLSPNTAFRCGQIFRNGGFPPFGIRGVFRVYFLFFEIGRFRHILKPLSLVLRRGAIIAFLGHY